VLYNWKSMNADAKQRVFINFSTGKYGELGAFDEKHCISMPRIGYRAIVDNLEQIRCKLFQLLLSSTERSEDRLRLSHQ
jgi:hypothetical protein